MLKKRIIIMVICLAALTCTHNAEQDIQPKEQDLIQDIEFCRQKLKDLSDIIKVLTDEQQRHVAARILEFEEIAQKVEMIKKIKEYELMLRKLDVLRVDLIKHFKSIEQYCNDCISNKRMNNPNERDIFEVKSENPALNIDDHGIQYVQSANSAGDTATSNQFDDTLTGS